MFELNYKKKYEEGLRCEEGDGAEARVEETQPTRGLERYGYGKFQENLENLTVSEELFMHDGNAGQVG